MKHHLKNLQEKLNIYFHDELLLRQAFTHSSYVNENRATGYEDNERMEFLGDAVLELAVSEYLFEHYQNRSEGELTKMRASIVCEPSLMNFAEALDFGSYVLLGKGEEQTGGRSRPALLADVFESFVGALFLDQGIEAVRTFLKQYLFAVLPQEDKLRTEDFKTLLQELIQQDSMGVVEYRIVDESGPAHERIFSAEVYVNEIFFGKGTGRSKKEAEQQAASHAIQKLNRDNS